MSADWNTKMNHKEEKICLITGADSGIGKATAKGLAQLGFTLLLTARCHVRGERTVKELKAATCNNDIHLFIADLSSQESISNLAQKIKEKYNRIDILINNAGAHFSKKHITVDGIEATFAVNYLSRFLLTNLLLDLLKQSHQGRIISVSAEFHRKGKINFEDLNLNENYSAHSAVAQSKLADILFTYSLNERLNGSNISVNCLHPGIVSTNIIYSDPDANPAIKFLYSLFSLFFKPSEKGAETILYLAVSPEVTKITGKYFINKKAVASSPASYDKAIAEKLWQESERLAEKYLTKV
jgi:NAD(P)-dependent dehydrogenase (short-subunit alcohol dehydrogenase family)